VGIETFYSGPIAGAVWPPLSIICQPIKVKPDNFESVMHASDKQIVFACDGGMPFDTPSTPTYVCSNEGNKWFTKIEEADTIVVTVFQKQI
jgi:hypothetical protein